MIKREIHTHIHLDYTRVEILSCIKKKNPLILPAIFFFFFIIEILSGIY